MNREVLCLFHETDYFYLDQIHIFADVSILWMCHLGEMELKAAVKVKGEQENEMTPESFMKERTKDMLLYASYLTKLSAMPTHL